MRLLEEPRHLPGSAGMLTQAKETGKKSEGGGNIAERQQAGEFASEIQT
jgi:hypothetical protein